MIETLLLCLGCFIAGFGTGGLVGMMVTQWAADDRPAVTAWGESTALWSEVDWNWWENVGRHSELAWAARQRTVDPIYDEQGQRVPYA